ncbi:SCO1664 family protein [Intrasporangium sp. DVR]|uniref:SCO1664 family protein n=1 Tax=Intrasporangium sp. DVR TaxID=3127867 RepID=UPI00313A6DA4
MATVAEGGFPEVGGTPRDAALLGDLEVVGRLAASSNVAVLVRLLAADDAYAIYKPVRGEQPLWDFPEGTLAGREVAAHLVSEAGGWHLVPATVLRDGPLGAGSVQRWVGDPFTPLPDDQVVDLAPAGSVPPGWLPTFSAETSTGEPVTVVHAATDDVRALAVLDAVINNSDRKGSHCLRDAAGRLWAIDHGVTFHATPKLRTVLWGWSGDPLTDADLGRLERLRDALDDPAVGLAEALETLLPHTDVLALRERVARLLRLRRHPRPSPGWPAVPWPPL